MTAALRVVVEHDIQPEDGETCAACIWRQGYHCELFVTELVPVTASLEDHTCWRSVACCAAEKDRYRWHQKKQRRTVSKVSAG